MLPALVFVSSDLLLFFDNQPLVLISRPGPDRPERPPAVVDR